MAACPGWAPRSPTAVSAARDFEQDMGAIARWSPQLVLTLLENDEVWEYRVGMLPQTLAAHGIHWQHFPMSPNGLPDDAFARQWSQTGAAFRDMLRAGGKLLVHCSDGMLRSGFLAGRLLIELGCRPEDALNRVQAVRPGALTLPEQRCHLLQHAPASRADGSEPAAGTGEFDATPASAAAHAVHALVQGNKPGTPSAAPRESSAPVELAKYRQSR